jgi:RNA-directed DNA polymerase
MIFKNAENLKLNSGSQSEGTRRNLSESESGAVKITAKQNNLPHKVFNLLEAMLERGNMLAALKRVEQNKGAAGCDGLQTSDLRNWLKENWLHVKGELLAGKYRPQPVLRVDIPKPDGKGVRKLGIPCVLDRLLQQALLQILSPIFDPTFSSSSYGFRPGKSAHQAVLSARSHVASGKRWVVDLDLEKFFDRVNHDILMSRIARKIGDKHILRLIRGYLRSGMMNAGVVEATHEGTPQGGPLTP